MTTKQIVLSTLIFVAMNNIALAMENENLKETIFQTYVEQLSKPIADFVMDFKTWPKEEQDKMVTFHNNNGRGYFINGKPAASSKYNSPYGLGFYLDCRLDQQQITPFLDAIDYLKKQR